MDPFKKGALFAFGFLSMIATATIALQPELQAEPLGPGHQLRGIEQVDIGCAEKLLNETVKIHGRYLYACFCSDAA